MRRVNIVITCILTAIALVAWGNFVLWFYVERWPGQQTRLTVAIAFSIFACVGWVLINRISERSDDETRCRRCRHILRGLTEARCPECGEVI